MCEARFRSLPGGNLGAGKGLSKPDSKPIDPHPSVKWSLTAIKKEVTWVSHSRHRERVRSGRSPDAFRSGPRRVRRRRWSACATCPRRARTRKRAGRLIYLGVTRASHRLIIGLGGDGRFGQLLGA